MLCSGWICRMRLGLMQGSLMVQKAQGENITVLLFLFLLLHFIARSIIHVCLSYCLRAVGLHLVVSL